MLRRRTVVLALAALAGAPLGCSCDPDDRPHSDPDAGCTEPDPRDPKGIPKDEPCEASYECVSTADTRLVCMGIGDERQSVCTDLREITDTDIPELWDPGCYDRPEEAPIGHCDDPDARENSIQRDGCVVRTYEIPDPCCPDADGICRYDCKDFVRQEVWRNCGCCWRLIRLIEVMPEECRQ